MTASKSIQLVKVESRIITARGVKVILDGDLAEIYGVTTSRPNEQVKRNLDRFPEDFVFQLTNEEFTNLISQNATSSSRHGGRRKLPYVFTEHGAIMAANVLKSKRAVQMSVFVVRALVRLREVAATHHDMAAKIRELEQKVGKHDTDIQAIINAIRQLMIPPESPKKRIGFSVEEPKVKYRTARSSAYYEECGPVRRNAVKAEEKLYAENEINGLIVRTDSFGEVTPICPPAVWQRK